MSRRRAHAAEAEHDAGMERWLLTYADMITLLLALFIVLYAISVVNEQKLGKLRESLAGAFVGKAEGGGPEKANVPETGRPTETVQARAQDAAELERLARANRELERLRAQVQQVAATEKLTASVNARVDGRGLVIRVLSDDILFAVGSADLRPGAPALLAPLARLLGTRGNGVRVEGHTDSVPIHTARFRSNWELSTARAASVVHYLIRNGVRARRLSAAGFAAQHPAATNATATGRARNRRIEIVVLRPAAAEVA